MPTISALRRNLPPLPPAEPFWKAPAAYPCTEPGGDCGACANCYSRVMAEGETESRRIATQLHTEALAALNQAIVDSRPVEIALRDGAGRVIFAGRPHEEGDIQLKRGDVYAIQTSGWSASDHRLELRWLMEMRLRGVTVQVCVSGSKEILGLYRRSYELHRLSPLGRELWIAVGAPIARKQLDSVETPDSSSYF